MFEEMPHGYKIVTFVFHYLLVEKSFVEFDFLKSRVFQSFFEINSTDLALILFIHV